MTLVPSKYPMDYQFDCRFLTTQWRDIVDGALLTLREAAFWLAQFGRRLLCSVIFPQSVERMCPSLIIRLGPKTFTGCCHG